MRTRRHYLRATAAICCGVAVSLCAQAEDDRLAQGFRTPPNSAAPRVWWHWLNGNISEEGVRLDLEWMRQIGIGGAQIFEGDLGTPKVVTQPLVYMTPEWKSAFRAASQSAKSLGLDLTIASAPGWSSAGGPWVSPADAMKKLVWSETTVAGGSRYRNRLTRPPDVAGPFQDIPTAAVTAGSPRDLPRFYKDAAVVAYRDLTARVLAPLSASSPTGPIDVHHLPDGNFGTGLDVPIQSDGSTWIEYRFKDPQSVSAATVELPLLQGFGSSAPPVAELQTSDDGNHFKSISILSTTTAAVRSASFRAVTSKIFRIVLRPETAGTFRDSMAPSPGVVPMSFGPPSNSYRVTQWQMYGDGRVNAFAEKAGFSTAPDYYALDTPKSAVKDAARLADVIDLTALMKPDGSLDWKAPAGSTWKILRMGYSLTGQRNHPAPQMATGLEVDKLNGGAVDRYFDAYLSKYDDVVDSGAVNSLLTDSIESEAQNWTDDFIVQFRGLRGYDPVRWLPTLTGVVIGSSTDSDRFLWDFRKTIADLLASEYYQHTAAKAHARGWTYYAEALENHRPQLGNDMQMRQPADIPMGAMWIFPKGGHPDPTYIADLQGAASLAHIYGRPFVGAESMTSFGHPWAYSPRDLKQVADLELSLGVTRFAIHESTHQPLTDRKPGLALAPLLGQYFNRNETWAPVAGAWVSYLSRASFLLQQGKPHAQIAYFFGEEAPLVSLYGDEPVKDIPPEFPFDFFDADALINCLSADTSGLTSCGGAHYQVLYLGGMSNRLSVRVLSKLLTLVRSGAVLIGQRPAESPSLADAPAAFRDAVDSLFGPAAEKGVPHIVGRGKVVEAPLEPTLRSLHIEPDWTWRSVFGNDVRVLHRELPEGAIYFISNQAGHAVKGELGTQIVGPRPQLWHAEAADIEPAAFRIEGNRTYISVDLKTDESVFIVLRERETKPQEDMPRPAPCLLSLLPEKWSLILADQNSPAIALTKLASWTESTEAEVRYFSGTGIYKSNLNVPAKWLGGGDKIYLDLGRVDDIAKVTLNGKPVGVAWHAPYQLDVSSFLTAGNNKITVEVTNLWVNRLIGDAQPGAQPHAFTTGPTYTADTPLRSSGLIGPVQLLGSACRRIAKR